MGQACEIELASGANLAEVMRAVVVLSVVHALHWRTPADGKALRSLPDRDVFPRPFAAALSHRHSL